MSGKSLRKNRRKGCRRNNRQSGGNGASYSVLGGPVAGAPIINNYDGAVTRASSCDWAARPGFITGMPIKGGLPGFSGGGRRRRGSRRRSTRRKQRGGVYTFAPSVVGSSAIAIPGREYTGCGEGRFAVQNPLNQDSGFPKSVLTAPPPPVQRGGAGANTAGVFGADAMVYEAPRAGYAVMPATGASPGSGLYHINVPYSSQPTTSGACTKTGGGWKKSRKANRKANRKGSRKNRKGSRKGNRK